MTKRLKRPKRRVPPEVSAYMAKIGAKGGAAGKGTTKSRRVPQQPIAREKIVDAE